MNILSKTVKLKFVFIILLSLTSILPANATGPDTIWTQGANQAGYFTPDGTKIIFVVGECVDVSDGHKIWSNDTNSFMYPIFTLDSLYYYDYDLSKHRISDGAKVNDGPALKLKTLPPYFSETEAVSNGIGERGILLSADQRYVYSIFAQNIIDTVFLTKIGEKSILCKFDLLLDSLIYYKPFIKNGDTLDMELVFPEYYIPQTDEFVMFFGYGSNGRCIRYFNANTLDSVGELCIDLTEYGAAQRVTQSSSGRYLGFGNDKGTIIIIDLINKTLINAWHERENLKDAAVWKLVFSKNDSFIVTSGGYGDSLRVKIWDIFTRNLIHEYSTLYPGEKSIDISPDNTKIISASIDRTALLRARWIPVTGIDQRDDDIDAMIVSPNPASDFIEISEGSNGCSPLQSDVRIYNVFGQTMSTPVCSADTPASGGQVKIDVSGLATGMYFVRIGDRVGKFVKF